MKKKIKDITIEDMINVCNSHAYESCLNCPLFEICSRSPYEIKVKENIYKEINL